MHCHWQRPLTVFQSAGSREPDPTSKTSSGCAYGFNPQARESLIEFSEEFTEGQISFNPQARESLIPRPFQASCRPLVFQSAGSREPDQETVIYTH